MKKNYVQPAIKEIREMGILLPVLTSGISVQMKANSEDAATDADVLSKEREIMGDGDSFGYGALWGDSGGF